MPKAMGETYFICAAVQVIDPTNSTIVEFRGYRHHLIRDEILRTGYGDMYKKWHNDGFIMCIDGIDMFVHRDEATRQAKRLGYTMIGPDLTSEDLWTIEGEPLQ